MNLKSVGYFREMLDGSPRNPSIKDYIHKGTSDINERKKLITKEVAVDGKIRLFLWCCNEYG